MAVTYERPRRHERVATRLRGRILCGDRSFPVTVLSLSAGGFYAEGLGLDQIGHELVLEVDLVGEGEPSWSPKSRGPSPQNLLRASCTLLYADFGREAAPGQGTVGLGARFDELDDADAVVLRAYLDDIIQTRERRPRGGAVPRPPAHAPSDPLTVPA
jgi:hypothetical protein